MGGIVFFDCGGQFDLSDIDGTLYVPGTRTILPRIAALKAFAAARTLPRICLAVTHVEGDADITTGKPDYKTTFPVHCVGGTPGWKPLPSSACERAVEIPRDPHAARPVRESLAAYHAEVLIEVPGFDPWGNPALSSALDVLAPTRAVVYGVPADKLVATLVNGLLERGIAVSIVEDAVKPFDVKAWDALRPQLAEKGVAFVAAGAPLDVPAAAPPAAAASGDGT